jgi:hypothetical protein
MSVQAHMEMLTTKHHKLEDLINHEAARPAPDFGTLQTWKKQKLLLKEEMERLRGLYGNRQGDVA